MFSDIELMPFASFAQKEQKSHVAVS